MNPKKKQPKQSFKLADAELTEFKKYKWQAFFAPVDPASVVLFRIVFGAIMCWEMIRYFKNDWISRYWIDPRFHFTYWPFDFLQPLQGNGMIVLCAGLGILAFFIMIGFLYRVATILFFIGFTYTYLLEQTRYLNHFYLVILISFIMIFIPANRVASVDARLFKNTETTIPSWSLWLLRFVVGLPYFFGGIAKINHDWLMGEPMRGWLSHDTDFPVIGPFFKEDWMVYLVSYTGLLIDLLLIPLLLFRRTRKWAFMTSVVFNLINSRLFSIGIFPWFMLAATTLYFHPSWPRKIFYWFIPDKKRKVLRSSYQWTIKRFLTGREKIILVILATWALIHILIPLRHFLIPGDVHWTEQGHKYSWHMKLRSKRGEAVFIVRNKSTGEEFVFNNRDFLTSWQERKMAAWPNLIWQFAYIIKKDFQEKGIDVAVYANVKASLNGREYQQLIDPNVDLASEERPVFSLPKWIIPLKTPLRKQLGKENDEMDE